MATPNQGNPRAEALGLWTLTALVVGNMIGSGVFLLPASLAPYGGASFLVQRAVSGGPVPGTARVDIRVAGLSGGRAALSLLVPAQGAPR